MAIRQSITEMVHLMYLNDNALEFLQAIIKGLNREFEKRKKAWQIKLDKRSGKE